MYQCIWVILLAVAVLCDDCSPLYTRIFYDPVPAPELKVDMIVMFNTLSQCPDSYIYVKYLNSQDEFPCTIQTVTIPSSIPTVPYLQHYVHSCSLEIDSASQVSQFTYSILPVNSPVTYTVELASDTLPFRMVVMANVDILNDDGYRPFAQAFQTLMDKRKDELVQNNDENHYRINAMVLNGGFAKEFLANKGQNFNKILRMISQFSAVWPLMLNMGPAEYTLEAEMKLVAQCFIFGGVGPGEERTPMQGYSFARKVNLIFLETSSQYYADDTRGTAEFNRTLAALKSFLSGREQNGNEFNIVLNHFPLFCSDTDDGSPFSCQKALDNLAPLKEQLSSGTDYLPVDLYLTAFLDDYERNYPYRQGGFMTLEQSRYGRGDFINVNEGVAGLDSAVVLPKTENLFTAVRDTRAGFGLLTIKGYGQLKQKAPDAVIEKQTVARRIYDQQHARGSSGNDLLDEDYLRSEDLSELDLFLLNYKHVVVDGENGLVVGDVFRIVTDPQGKTVRHQLRAQ